MALAQAKKLQEDFLGWIDEYNMGYAQNEWSSQEEFERWILEECQKFIKGWRRKKGSDGAFGGLYSLEIF